jgi:hypothetical protein
MPTSASEIGGRKRDRQQMTTKAVPVRREAVPATPDEGLPEDIEGLEALIEPVLAKPDRGIPVLVRHLGPDQPDPADDPAVELH